MKISEIEKSLTSKGKRELLRHMAGEELNKRGMIMAKCFECCAGYADGKYSCGIPSCPLFPLMPYRDREPDQKQAVLPAGGAQNQVLQGDDVAEEGGTKG